jgi:hypothetical protein
MFRTRIRTLLGLKKGESEYFAKYTIAQLFETEKKCHEKLDPLSCPSIIKMADAIPVSEGGIIVTPMYTLYSQNSQILRQIGYETIVAGKIWIQPAK